MFKNQNGNGDIMSRVCLFLADGCEEIEALTVADLLRRAGIEIDLVSITDSTKVEGAHNIIIESDRLFKDIDLEVYDMLVLPGGMPGTLNLGKHKGVTENVVKFNNAHKLIAAICAAPSILGDLGILDGKRAICYPGYEDRLKGADICLEPVVSDQNIITSRGMGTAIPFGLAIIEKLSDKDTADKIKNSICC